MKPIMKPAMALTALLAAFSASAAQKEITVTADIDPTAAITRADGSALPDQINMQYLPGSGLRPHTEQVKLWSNDVSKTLEVRLGHSPALNRIFGGAAPIPLSVSLNGQSLATTATPFAPGILFPGGDITGGSIVMPLNIAQTTHGVVAEAGVYSGIVSIIVTQSTS